MSDSEMISNPMVSVIITNYNYGRYLGEAIESVLSQSYQNFELIIVDDGSTDTSREIIESYKQKYPDKVIPIIKENGGQASAFNAGFNASQGSIISFLDSDDFWKPERLMTIIDIFKEDIYSIVQHNMEIVDERSKTLGKLYRKELFTGDAKKILLDHCHLDFFVPTSGVCFKRDVLENIFPVPESWQICADAFLTRIVLFYGHLYSFEQPLGFYRIHGENYWMNTKRQRKAHLALSIINAINRHLYDNNFDIQVEPIKNPLYRCKYISIWPDLTELLDVLKMLPGYPYMKFREKAGVTYIILKSFIYYLIRRLINGVKAIYYSLIDGLKCRLEKLHKLLRIK